MIDSDLTDTDLGARGGVHLIERKKERRKRVVRVRWSGKEIAE